LAALLYDEPRGENMHRRVLLVALVALVCAVFAQAASADPVHAKSAGFFTAVCGGTQIPVVVNGNGEFTPAHVLGSTSVFVPTAFDLTFSFTPTGGVTESETDTSAKAHQPSNAIACELPADLNTFTGPDGTFTLSGTVTGFFTPAR
jgi:opacity protein-like surface antigen